MARPFAPVSLYHHYRINSPSPVIGDEIERVVRELRPDIDVAVVSNPEFLREGAAIHDFKHPDAMTLSGTDDERTNES